MEMWQEQSIFSVLFARRVAYLLPGLWPQRSPCPLEPRAFLVGLPHAGLGARDPIVVKQALDYGPQTDPDGAEYATQLKHQLDRRWADLLASTPPASLKRPDILLQAATGETDALLNKDTIFLPSPTTKGCYDVYLLLQVDLDGVTRLPRFLRSDAPEDGRFASWAAHSFLDAARWQLMFDLTAELEAPQLNRYGLSRNLNKEHFATDVADIFLYRINRTFNRTNSGLFREITNLSSRMYEGQVCRSRIVLAKRTHPAVRLVVTFVEPIHLGNASLARKLVQTASDSLCLLWDGEKEALVGLCTVSAYKAAQEDLFDVVFRGHLAWDLQHDRRCLMEVRDGVPYIPVGRFSRERLQEALEIFHEPEVDRLVALVEQAIQQKHGTMVVISSEAQAEAKRLVPSLGIEPCILPTEAISGMTGIDGALLVDPAGVCHALGVILDGLSVNTWGGVSRGARYNSAVRYVRSRGGCALAIVISEDGDVDIVLPPQRRAE
jgi:hypothetical protein